MDANAAASIAATATVVAAGAAVIYAGLTLLLVFEARANRNTRLEANVAAYPTVEGSTGMYMTVIAENYGPASATDVVIFMRLRGDNREAIPSSERRLKEPV